MKNIITITNKGQTTLPAPIRRKLGLSKAGGVLQIRFNERKGELIVTKPANIDDLSARITRYIKSGTKPVVDVDEYYQTNRAAGK